MSVLQNSINIDDLLTTREAALILRVKPNTLEIQRSEGKGPPFIRLGERGSAVRYLRTEIDKWLSEQSSAHRPNSSANDSADLTAKLALSPEQAATLTGMCRSNVFKAIREGKLSARKLGRRTLILQSDLQKFLESLPVRGAA